MFYRPAKAYINLPALRHNLAIAKSLAPNSKVLAVVKANGYGHGICRVVQQLVGADGFGVASIDEALLLRQKGFLHRILLLEGLFSEIELPLAVQNRLDIVVHSMHQLQWVLRYQTALVINIWLKIDTGMHRLGFAIEEVPTVIQQLKQNSNSFNIHLMSHLASADERTATAVEFTKQQIKSFNRTTEAFDFPKSLHNSAGLQSYGSACYDWVRPGILLYGIGSVHTPFDKQAQLKPVMRLESAVIAIRWIEAGEFVGYGNDWQAPKKTCVAVIAIGYGDGYPRHAPTGTPVLVEGKRVSLIGRVSMDMITVDITKYHERIHIDSLATLWGGEGLSVDEVASYANTISYELLCGITSRVPMIEIQ
ncbi:MAG TPA: alanine racemase [Thiomicrorhabdus sp.]|nr:alanine racemase [Thiomicrorhabdus sp.]